MAILWPMKFLRAINLRAILSFRLLMPFKIKYNLAQLGVIAVSGLFSNTNVRMPDGTELEHLLITNQRQKQLIYIFPENFG